jgi:DNA mismatch repair protein MutL
MIFYAHKKYIVTQVKSGLMIIDANRAHRRILFEKALDALRKGVPFSQQLLFAQTFQLKKEIYELLQRYDAKISRLGFEIKYHGKNTISITGVPSSVKLGNESKTLLGILNALYKYEEGDTEKIISETFAEEAAVKEGEDLNENELGLIVDQLFATSQPSVTPEGKRTFVKISHDELREKFEL